VPDVSGDLQPLLPFQHDSDLKLGVGLHADPAQIESQIEDGIAKSIIDCVDRGLGTVHRAALGRRRIDTGAKPFKIIGDHTVDGGLDLARRLQIQCLAARALKRNGEPVRRRNSEQTVDIAEVLAIKPVELLIVGRRVLGAVPPAPVAAFCNPELLPGQPQLFGVDSRRGRVRGEEVARVGQIIPGAIVLFGSYPNVKIGIDPRAGYQMGLQARLGNLLRLAGCDGADIRRMP